MGSLSRAPGGMMMEGGDSATSISTRYQGNRNMENDGKTTRPTEGGEQPRRPKLPAWSRDATAEGAGLIFTGGIAPEVIEKLKARDTGEPEQPGDDPDPAGDRLPSEGEPYA